MRLIIVFLILCRPILGQQSKIIPATSIQQNDHFLELKRLKILNSGKISHPQDITGFKIKICSFFSWGLGKEEESIDFKTKKARLFSNRTNIKKSKDNRDSIFYLKSEYFLDTSDMVQIVNDINLEKRVFTFPIGDSINHINFENLVKEAPETIILSCIDCTQYYLELTIYSKADTVNYSCQFDETFAEMDALLKNNPVDVQSLLNWLYLFKILNLSIPEHHIVKYIQ